MEAGQVNPLNLTSRPGFEEKPLEALMQPLEEMRQDARTEDEGSRRRRKRDTEMILRPEAYIDKDGRRKNVISSVRRRSPRGVESNSRVNLLDIAVK